MHSKLRDHVCCIDFLRILKIQDIDKMLSQCLNIVTTTKNFLVLVIHLERHSWTRGTKMNVAPLVIAVVHMKTTGKRVSQLFQQLISENQ